MKARPRNLPPKAAQPIGWDDETWYLRPPFKDLFDRTQWWKGVLEDDLEPEGLSYEVARRHQRIGKLRSKFLNADWHAMELRKELSGEEKKIFSKIEEDLGNEPIAVLCLCLIGLKTWPNLTPREKDYWLASAGNLKGVDCRQDSDCRYSITLEALGHVVLKRARSLKLARLVLQFYAGLSDREQEIKIELADPEACEKARNLLVEEFQKNPPAETEIEAAIAEAAVRAHREGHGVFGAVLNMSLHSAEGLSLAGSHANKFGA